MAGKVNDMVNIKHLLFEGSIRGSGGDVKECNLDVKREDDRMITEVNNGKEANEDRGDQGNGGDVRSSGRRGR
jgi:hypothetical protein